MNTDILSKFQTWFNAPFQSGGNVVNWALFTILIVTVAFLWTRVLREID